MGTPERRTTSFSLTARGFNLLKQMADYHGITMTAVVEMLIREKARTLDLE